MKRKLLIVLFFSLILHSCHQKKDEVAIIAYMNEVNFGTIKVNDTVIRNFKIKNTSSNNLIIKQVKTSCGCTVAKLKDSIIETNQDAEIEVKFISDKENIGAISKSIVVEANTKPNFTVLYLKGQVAN